MSSSTSTAGSADESIKIGYIRRAHGIKGAVVVRPLTDDLSRFAVGSVLETDRTDRPRLTVDAMQPHKDGLLVSFADVNDRNTSEQLRGTSFLINPSQRRDLEGDEYWPDQLIGLNVVDSIGTPFGIVVDIITGAAQDRLQVQSDAGTFEIPFVEAIVADVDIPGGVVIVAMPEGLVP